MTSTTSHPNALSRLIEKGGARVLRNRRLMRAPIWLYRARLGFLLGSRFLMLEHIGRVSGTKRYVVLEVIGHPAASTFMVISGFGARSQWFRNVQANPRVRVWASGRSPRSGTASSVPPAEADAVLQTYAERHPRAWETFKPILENTLGAPIGAEGTALPVVKFQLEAAPTASA